MQHLIIIIASLIFSSTFAQGNYEQAMIKGMDLMDNDLMTAEAHFTRIAAAESEEWLPAYWVAFCNINTSWEQEASVLNLKLERAQEYLDKAEALSPNNVEIIVLQALLNTAYVASDPQTYGMRLSGPTTALYQKAMALEPNNPRVVSNGIQWEIGSAQFFGAPIQPLVERLEESVKLYDLEGEMAAYLPQWGKEGTLEAIERYKNQ